jgi:hypothetical protein
MLFTPSPPFSPQSVSSSVESNLSPTHPIASQFNRPNVDNIISSSDTTNGPPTSQLYDHDFFHSPHSSSSSSHPSIHLTPIKKPINFKVLKTRRRDSYPNLSVDKKLPRFHLPVSITSSIRHALMASVPTPDPNLYHTENKSHLWSNNNIMPVANPVAAAALIEDNEIIIDDEPLPISITPSPLGTPKNSDRITRSPTAGSTTNFFPSSRKVTLNVGGVRHEGNLFIYVYISFE